MLRPGLQDWRFPPVFSTPVVRGMRGERSHHLLIGVAQGAPDSEHGALVFVEGDAPPTVQVSDGVPSPSGDMAGSAAPPAAAVLVVYEAGSALDINSFRPQAVGERGFRASSPESE